MPHIAGDTIADSHTTVIEAAAPLVKQLQRISNVSKIVLGPIKNEGGSGGRSHTRLKIIDEQTCTLLAVSGGGAHQDIRVMLDDLETNREKLREYLTHFAQKRDWKTDTLDRR